MQNAALAAMGLAPEWSYEAIEVEPERFAALVAGLPGDGFLGVNVTVPHKLAALAAAGRASEAASAIGAANTLTFRDGEVEAENTDVAGIIGALPASPAGMRALVMGAGGSARAAVWALKSEGAEVHVWNRTQAKAEALAEEFGVLRAADGEAYELVLNATTVGMTPEGQPLEESGFGNLKALPIAADGLHAGQVVVDLVYGNTETELVHAARAAGAAVADGLDVLVLQGAASLRLWTGEEPPLDVMRAAVRGER
jgi:shikimate dehydrogenase